MKMGKEKKMSKSRVVVVTGHSSGIGSKIAEFFRVNGDVVYGLSRHKGENEKINFIECDVTDPLQVKEAIEEIDKREGRIDILINNAGMGISGSVENTTLDDIKKIFAVNFYGAVNVTQCVLPIMRRQNGGKILCTSSLASFFPIPFQSFYSATKASLDIWAKALRLEVKPFNIQICNCLLGDTKSGFTSARKKSVYDEGSVYEDTVKRSVEKMEKDEQNGKDPMTVAKTMYKLSKKKKMPATKIVGGLNRFLGFLNKILPQRFMLFVVGKMYT